MGRWKSDSGDDHPLVHFRLIDTCGYEVPEPPTRPRFFLHAKKCRDEFRKHVHTFGDRSDFRRLTRTPTNWFGSEGCGGAHSGSPHPTPLGPEEVQRLWTAAIRFVKGIIVARAKPPLQETRQTLGRLHMVTKGLAVRTGEDDLSEKTGEKETTGNEEETMEEEERDSTKEGDEECVGNLHRGVERTNGDGRASGADETTEFSDQSDDRNSDGGDRVTQQHNDTTGSSEGNTEKLVDPEPEREHDCDEGVDGVTSLRTHLRRPGQKSGTGRNPVYY